MKVWFVVYCKPQKDVVAEGSLARQGFEVYRPMINKLRTTGTRTRRINESLFPRYIFLNVDPEIKSLTSVKYSPGVTGFVKFGDRYSTISDSVIDSIKACEYEHRNEGGKICAFKKGEDVFINGKGFSDIKATFCEMHGESRVVVLLKMLGGMSTMTVPTTYVSKTSVY